LIESISAMKLSTANFSAANYAAKAERWKSLWPELTVLPADAGSQATAISTRRPRERDP